MVIEAALIGQVITALIVAVVLVEVVKAFGRHIRSAERQAAALERSATIAERGESVRPAQRTASPPTASP